MAKAVWNNKVLAESDDIEKVEGNIYFPPSSVKKENLEESDTPHTCPWKGKAKYYHVVVEGEKNEDAAWEYPEPKEAAENIKGFVAFDKSKVDVIG